MSDPANDPPDDPDYDDDDDDQDEEDDDQDEDDDLDDDDDDDPEDQRRAAVDPAAAAAAVGSRVIPITTSLPASDPAPAVPSRRRPHLPAENAHTPGCLWTIPAWPHWTCCAACAAPHPTTSPPVSMW